MQHNTTPAATEGRPNDAAKAAAREAAKNGNADREQQKFLLVDLDRTEQLEIKLSKTFAAWKVVKQQRDEARAAVAQAERRQALAEAAWARATHRQATAVEAARAQVREERDAALKAARVQAQEERDAAVEAARVQAQEEQDEKDAVWALELMAWRARVDRLHKQLVQLIANEERVWQLQQQQVQEEQQQLQAVNALAAGGGARCDSWSPGAAGGWPHDEQEQQVGNPIWAGFRG